MKGTGGFAPTQLSMTLVVLCGFSVLAPRAVYADQCDPPHTVLAPGGPLHSFAGEAVLAGPVGRLCEFSVIAPAYGSFDSEILEFITEDAVIAAKATVVEELDVDRIFGCGQSISEPDTELGSVPYRRLKLAAVEPLPAGSTVHLRENRDGQVANVLRFRTSEALDQFGCLLQAEVPVLSACSPGYYECLSDEEDEVMLDDGGCRAAASSTSWWLLVLVFASLRRRHR